MSAPVMYLSRVRLRRDVPGAALRAILAPDGVSERAATTHRMVWTLFSDSPDRERDFLWRESDPGSFYCLSSRPPEDRHGLFHVDPPREFSPSLAVGDRLGFALRVNATVARGGQPKVNGQKGVRGKPCDIVMDALKRDAEGERGESRRRLLVPVARDWLSRQGAKHGFALPSASPAGGWDEPGEADGVFSVKGYRVLQMERGRGSKPLRAGVLDLEGVLEVRDPAAFLQAVGQGFGRAKAFGCGLMLVRRA